MDDEALERLGRCFFGPEEWARLRRQARIRRAVDRALPYARLVFYIVGAIASVVIVVAVVS